MTFGENPFQALHVTVRDSRHVIIERAEQVALSSDPTRSAIAKSMLTTPARRLEAEVAWLPGVSPKRSRELVDIALQRPSDLEAHLSGIPTLAACNLLA